MIEANEMAKEICGRLKIEKQMEMDERFKKIQGLIEKDYFVSLGYQRTLGRSDAHARTLGRTFLCSDGRTLARALRRKLARWYLARTLGRTHARAHARTFGRPLARSDGRTLGRTLGLGRTLEARTNGRNTHGQTIRSARGRYTYALDNSWRARTNQALWWKEEKGTKH